MRSPRPIFVDQANYLQERSLGTLCFLWEKRHIPIVLVGTKTLFENFYQSKLTEDVRGQLTSRIALHYHLPELTKAETEAILRHALGAEVTEEMIEQIHQVTGGNFRSVDMIIPRILELEQRNRQKLADGTVPVTFGIWQSLRASAIIVICAYETTRFAVLSLRPARHRRRHMGFSWIAYLRQLNAPRLYLDPSAMAHMARLFFALRSSILVQLRHKPSPLVEKGRRSTAGDYRRTRDDVLASGLFRGIPACNRFVASRSFASLEDRDHLDAWGLCAANLLPRTPLLHGVAMGRDRGVSRVSSFLNCHRRPSKGRV